MSTVASSLVPGQLLFGADRLIYVMYDDYYSLPAVPGHRPLPLGT